jgi:hypothetical protein
MKHSKYVSMDHIRAYHEECGRTAQVTNMGVSNNKGHRVATFEALCLHCDKYFYFKIDPPTVNKARQVSR